MPMFARKYECSGERREGGSFYTIHTFPTRNLGSPTISSFGSDPRVAFHRQGRSLGTKCFDKKQARQDEKRAAPSEV